MNKEDFRQADLYDSNIYVQMLLGLQNGLKHRTLFNGCALCNGLVISVVFWQLF